MLPAARQNCLPLLFFGLTAYLILSQIHTPRVQNYISLLPRLPLPLSAALVVDKRMNIGLLQPGNLFPRRKFQPYSGSWGGSHDPDLASPVSVALAWWRGFHSFWTDRIDASAAELSLCRWVGGGMKGGRRVERGGPQLGGHKAGQLF